MKHFVVIAGSFIGGILVAPGSFVNEDDLQGATPGSNLVEIDEAGRPVNSDDLAKLQGISFNPSRSEIAAVSPHAPNPTRPQAIPGRQPFDAPLVRDGGWEPSQGVESDEAKEARIAILESELLKLKGVNDAIDEANENPEPPQRRGATTSTTTSDDDAVTSLVNSQSKEALLALAAEKGVEGVTADNNKREIAEKIIEADAA